MENVFGESYNYAKFIKPPAELGMSSSGSLDALAHNITGLSSYVDILMTGNSKASRTGEPLGGKFFMPTMGKCRDIATNQTVDRSMYINNQPTGNVPFIDGVNLDSMRGLVPGMISNTNVLNPFRLFNAFTEGNEPKCAKVKLPTINSNGVRSSQEGYIPLAELRDMVATKEVNIDDIRGVPLEGFTTKRQQLIELLETQEQLNTHTLSNVELLTITAFAGLFGYMIWKRNK
jgi:hypothetical protein